MGLSGERSRWSLERVVFVWAASSTLLSAVVAAFVSPWVVALNVFAGTARSPLGLRSVRDPSEEPTS